MKNTNPDERLVALLKESAGKPMSRKERQEQVISFVYGNLPARMKISREKVEKHVKEWYCEKHC